MSTIDIDENEMIEMYQWVDSFTLSKPKRTIARDFSDGVLYAEIIKKCIPNLVQLINYIPSSKYEQKKINWETLNKKVLHKIGCVINKNDIEGIIQCKPLFIEKALIKLKHKLKEYLEKNEIRKESESYEETEEEVVLTKESFYKKEMESQDQEIASLKEKIKKSETLLNELNEEKINLVSHRNTLIKMLGEGSNRNKGI